MRTELTVETVLAEAALRDAVLEIAHKCRKIGGRALLVGGCVRDAVMGIPSKDADMEVFGIEAEKLQKMLSESMPIITVGKAFGVFKVRGLELDIALPRRESKTGQGHKAFAIEGDPWMPLVDAAMRRDFTINALLFDPLTQELLDPLGGLADLEKSTLRHCSERFGEDPLRVLRGMQFLARFDYAISPQTLQICRRLDLEGLSGERIFEEWRKLIVKGVRPSRGLVFLRDCGWIRFFPELQALIDCPQDPRWHPEGDVWTHTLHCMDAFARERVGDEREDLVVGLAVLCHDFGKPSTTFTDEAGAIRSPEHEVAGERPACAFLQRLTSETSLIEDVLVLVTHHMRPHLLYDGKAGDSAVRRLAKAVGRIDRLLRVVSADGQGRPPLTWTPVAIEWLKERAAALAVADAAPKPIVQGRHLMVLGMQPGPDFKRLLNRCYEAQLEGEITTVEDGVLYLKRLLEESKRT